MATTESPSDKPEVPHMTTSFETARSGEKDTSGSATWVSPDKDLTTAELEAMEFAWGH
ncbi:MAG: hypothetical protein ACT4OY_06780 [Alphaproteobacteria bacterium]